MKKIRYCQVTLIILLLWGILSVVGFLGKDTIYKRYSINAAKTPYFVLVFYGANDGIFPWSSPNDDDMWEKWEQSAQSEMEFVPQTEEKELQKETQSVEEEPATEQIETKEFHQVEDDYFSDALFIGDSRTVGLHDYGGLDDSTFFATVGMNVYDLWKEQFCEVDGTMMTLEEALSTKKYGKIYFQIGLNEMGRGTVDGFMGAYQETVEKFRTLQPDAIIFVQAIMKVAKEKSDKDEIFNNEGITIRNDRIAQLADGKNIFYIDVNEVVCDEEGGLKKELTFDNIHLYGSMYDIWVDFLKTKGID